MKVVIGYVLLFMVLLGAFCFFTYAVDYNGVRKGISIATETLQPQRLALQKAEVALRQEILSTFKSEKYPCKTRETSGEFVAVICDHVYEASSSIYPVMKKNIGGLKGLEGIRGIKLVCTFSYSNSTKKLEMKACSRAYSRPI